MVESRGVLPHLFHLIVAHKIRIAGLSLFSRVPDFYIGFSSELFSHRGSVLADISAGGKWTGLRQQNA